MWCQIWKTGTVPKDLLIYHYAFELHPWLWDMESQVEVLLFPSQMVGSWGNGWPTRWNVLFNSFSMYWSHPVNSSIAFLFLFVIPSAGLARQLQICLEDFCETFGNECVTAYISLLPHTVRLLILFSQFGILIGEPICWWFPSKISSGTDVLIDDDDDDDIYSFMSIS